MDQPAHYATLIVEKLQAYAAIPPKNAPELRQQVLADKEGGPSLPVALHRLAGGGVRYLCALRGVAPSPDGIRRYSTSLSVYFSVN